MNYENHRYFLVGCYFSGIDGTMDYMPLSKDLTHRTAETTTIFRASEASWSKEMNSIGEAIFAMKMPGWVTDGPQLFRTKTGKLGMLWSNWGENRYAKGTAYSNLIGTSIQRQAKMTQRI